MSSFMRFSICATYFTLSLCLLLCDFQFAQLILPYQTVRKQCAEELKKLVQMQKMWALRKPVLDAHILSLQEKVLELEQEIDGIVMEKIRRDF